MLKTLKLPLGPLGTNCYLAWDNGSLEAVVIDPGGEPERVIAALSERRLRVVAIINTHGHGDHIAANREVKAATGAPILIHQADAPMLEDPELNLSALYGLPVTSPPADGFLVPGGKVAVGAVEFEVLHTPGHTPGGVSLYGAGVVFTGDALFACSVGRWDLPGGDEDLLIGAIRERLLTLPGETVVLSGHGQNTTIGEEQACNPFLI